MKKIRLYVNLTNNCNANCEFCCMWSDSSKKTFMNFETFKQIIDEHSEKFELQLYKEKEKHKDIVYEMVFHPNGNLNGSWVDNEEILLPYKNK